MATKTFEELKQLAIQIRDEKTNKQNTATRVGTAMLEHINKLEQDYYDKTQTDEELKERDDKLTELSNNIINISNKLQLKNFIELPIVGETITSYISSTRKVVDTTGNNSNTLIPVTEDMIGRQIKFVPTTVPGRVSTIVFLKDKTNLDVNGATPNICDGTEIRDYNQTIFFTIPDDCNYIYITQIVKDVNYSPDGLYISDSSGKDRLSNIEDEIEDIQSKLDEQLIFINLPITGDTFPGYISGIKGTVVTGTAQSILIPVTEDMIDKKIKLVPSSTNSSGTGLAFLSDKENLDVDGATPNFCDGTTVQNYNIETVLTIPKDCKYIYTSPIIEGIDYRPKWIGIETSVSNAIDSINNNYITIEPIDIIFDKIVDKDLGIVELTGFNGKFYLKKFEISRDSVYYADVYIGPGNLSFAGIGYTDNNDMYIGYEYPANTAGSSSAVFYKLNIPDNARYVYILGVNEKYQYENPAYQDSRLYSKNFISDVNIKPNQLYYYIAKVKGNILTCVESGIEIQDNVIDSAWGIIFPKSYQHKGDKITVIAMLHGASGVVSPSVLGYSNSGWISWRQLYLDAGFAVMDINGYGVSTNNDEKSRHWGNPSSVETLKHAFDFLKKNFNINDKIILQGSSMGGILAISYALTYPNDVLCIGNFAPGILCRMAKWASYSQSVAIAWGYNSAQELINDKLSNFIGYDLFMMGFFIHNGLIQDIDWGNFDCDSYIDNQEVIIKIHMNIPYRVWVGTLDTESPYKLSKLIVNALRNGGSNATYRIYEGVGHGMCSGSEYTPTLYNEALNWYKRFVE